MASKPNKLNKKVRLVLLGGGHTNTQVIKHIVSASVPENVHLILVSDYDTSLYSGMCPGGVAEQYIESQFSVNLVACCQKLKWTFIRKTIIEINPSKQLLIASDGTSIKYDILSIDIGCTNAGIDKYEGIRQYAISTRPLKLLMDRMSRKESELLQKLEDHCTSTNFTSNQPIFQKTIEIITVGGGAAGCELAMGITQRLNRNITRFLKDNELSDNITVHIKSTLITNGDSILTRDPTALQSAVSKAMKSRNIEIKTNHCVVRMDENHIYLQSKRNGNHITMPYDLCIFATGAASHHLKTHDIARDENGWFKVNRNLQSLHHRNIFGAGDCISLMDDNGHFDARFPPKSGVYAVRQGPILIHNLMEYLKFCADEQYAMRMKEYVPQSDFLRLLNTGDGKGIGCKHGIAFEGAWVWRLKDWIDVSWMNKFKVENLMTEDRKEFKPMIEEEEKEDQWTVEEAVTWLSINDEPKKCQGFAKLWSILLRMADDSEFCRRVVNAYKKMEFANELSLSKL